MKMFLRIIILTAVIFSALTAMLGWSIFTALSALLTAITLVLVRDGLAAHSSLSGFLTTVWLYWGLSYVSNLIEAVYFMVVPIRAAVSGACVGLIMALVVAGLLEAMTTPASERPMQPAALAAGAWWRVPVLAFAFFIIYLAAGIAIHPWIASFYSHQQLPTLTQLLRLQLCRGILDLACIYPVFWQWSKSRKRAVWVSACVFTVLCGWAPFCSRTGSCPDPSGWHTRRRWARPAWCSASSPPRFYSSNPEASNTAWVRLASMRHLPSAQNLPP
jgi:hypothetical protein